MEIDSERDCGIVGGVGGHTEFHSNGVCSELRLRNIPEMGPKIVSPYRGPQFVAEFMKELYRLLGVKLAATTTYHPQGDGQTEQLEQYH